MTEEKRELDNNLEYEVNEKGEHVYSSFFQDEEEFKQFFEDDKAVFKL